MANTLNAFDKIAKKTASVTASTDKVAAKVTEDIAITVDQFVANKAALKSLETTQKQIEAAIIDHVRPQQDELAYAGNFTKSMAVQGKKASVTYVTVDKFSIPQDEEVITALKKLIGKRFDDLFTTKRTISMKAEAIQDETVLNRIAAACEKAGLNLAEIFEVGDKIIGKDDLDRKQYDLPKSQLPVFRTLVKQNKPSLR